MSVAGVGKAKIGKQTRTYAKTFKLVSPKPGETSTAVYRLMPPIKNCAPTGQWNKFYSVHYGYSVVDPNDPTRLVQRPFVCVEKKNWRTKEIEVQCPACEKEQQAFIALKEATERYKQEGMSEEEIKTATSVLSTEKQKYNSDRKYHIHVMTPEGEFGTLKLSGKNSFKPLEMKINDLVGNDLDPFSPEEGVWFEFKRTGSKLNAVDTIDIVKDNISKTQSTIRMAPLSDEQLTKALEILPDLNEMYTIISPQQVQQIVDADGDPEIVQKVFDQGTLGKKQAPRAAAPEATTRAKVQDMAEEVEEAPAPVKTPPKKAAEVPAAAAPKASADAARLQKQKQMEELQRQMAALQQDEAAAEEPEAVVAPTPPPSAPKPMVGQVTVKKAAPRPVIAEKDAMELDDSDLAQMFPTGDAA